MNVIFRFFLASLCCVFVAASPARAEVINIEGTRGIINEWSPLGVTFEAGSYTVTPVNPQTNSDALYTAYFFGSTAGVWGAGYGIALSKDSIKYYYDSPSGYRTEAEAFAHAVGASFSLASRQTVYFGVLDSVYGDNSGGVSLNITAVPEPETYAMLLAGLVLMGAVARRRKLAA